MSCITVPKTWGASAAPRVEAVSPVLPVTTVHKRAAKKSRATPQLVDTVREVVQAFELEYAQVRAESVEVKAALDDRRTQLSDLRQHLENESSENGILEAAVQHRNSKNDKSEARLAALESEFSRILEDDRLIATRAAALESDLSIFTEEHRRIREKISLVSSHLDRAEATLGKRERVFAEGLRESERLSAAVQERRHKVEERRQCLMNAQEQAEKSRSLAREAAAEQEALGHEVACLRENVTTKESENAEAARSFATLKMEVSETQKAICEDRAAHTQDLRAAQIRLVELKKRVDGKERSNAEIEERIQTLQLAVAAESEAQDAKRGEIMAMRASREEAVNAEVGRLSAQLEAVNAEVIQADEAVEETSVRIRQANTEFSNLMAAMSAAFREYDQAVTANRELERGVAEAGSSLGSLRERSDRELAALRGTHDRLTSSIAEDTATAEADRQRAVELTETLHETQKEVDKMTSEVEAKHEKIAACQERLETGLAKQRSQEEERSEALGAAKEAHTKAQEAVLAARARLEHTQTELAEFRREAAEWAPPRATLTESDVQRVEKEAKSAIQNMRAGDDQAHAARVQSLKDTLDTIRKGGAARLKAEEDAAAARVTALQNKKLEALRSLMELRARAEAVQHTEATLTTEIRRRDEARRAAEARAAATQAATAQEARAVAAKAAAAKAAAVQAADAQATAAQAAAAQAVTIKAAVAQATAAQAVTAQPTATPAAPSRYTTPNNRPNHHSSGVHRLGARGLVRNSIQTPGRGSNGSGGSTPRFTTPETRSTVRSPGVNPSTSARPGASDSVRASGCRAAGAGGGTQDLSYDREVGTTSIESFPHLSHSGRHSEEPARRLKKSSRSSSKETSTRSQQASESTAEAAGSRKGVLSGKRHSGSSHRDGGGGPSISSRHKKKDTPSSRASSKVTPVSSNDQDRGRPSDATHGDRHRSGMSRKGTSKSKSRSPRHRPSSPRPSDKEYDLWTDNRLVSDSDFSFF